MIVSGLVVAMFMASPPDKKGNQDMAKMNGFNDASACAYVEKIPGATLWELTFSMDRAGAIRFHYDQFDCRKSNSEKKP